MFGINIQVHNKFFWVFVWVECSRRRRRCTTTTTRGSRGVVFFATTWQINPTSNGGFFFFFTRRTHRRTVILTRSGHIARSQTGRQPISLDDVIHTHRTLAVFQYLVYILGIRHTWELVDIIFCNNTHLNIHHQ